jgi:5-methylthioadenosine/S-adenosylhomocysteine deaminase
MRRILLLLLTAVLAQAESADWIYTARWVVTMDPQRRVIENGAIAVRGERIVAVGERSAVEKAWQPKQRLDRPNSLLLPGLINTHTHAPMSLIRGIADDLRLQEWLEKYIFPAEAKNVSPEFVRWGTRLACLEMILSGTTTYTDMYYFEEIIAEATKESGMRGVLGQTIIGFPVPDAKTPELALQRTEAFLKRFQNDPLITAAVAPHALYTNSEATLKAARALANKYDAPLLIHLSETKRENDEMRAKHGASPTQVLDRMGLFNGRSLGAHGVWLDDADIATLKARNAGIAHCPSSNMKLASGVAPLTRLLKAGVPVGLGPDGPAGSNNDFNLFEEMDLAAKLQKVISGDPQSITAMQTVEMATIKGARALGLEKEVGSLEAGKRADFITIRLDTPHAVPMYNVYSHLVYALKGSDVEDSVINGRPVMRDRQVLTLDRSRILSKAHEYRQGILKSLQ